jgi:flagellar basal body-associated protein FliL
VLYVVLLIILLIQFLVVLGAQMFVIFLARAEVPLLGACRRQISLHLEPTSQRHRNAVNKLNASYPLATAFQ